MKLIKLYRVIYFLDQLQLHSYGNINRIKWMGFLVIKHLICGNGILCLLSGGECDLAL